MKGQQDDIRTRCLAAGCGKGDVQRIMVFQQRGRAENKVAGIREYGRGRFLLDVVTIRDDLPPVIEDSRSLFPEEINADLVLDYLVHPDLSHDLAVICREMGIPVVASGKKSSGKGVYTPPICCALPPQVSLGAYGRCFGSPVFDVSIRDGVIQEISVKRGAPCGATWKAAARIRGLSPGEALTRMGLEAQFFCTANPAGWDPLIGKSPVHLAADIHSQALAKALKEAPGEGD